MTIKQYERRTNVLKALFKLENASMYRLFDELYGMNTFISKWNTFRGDVKFLLLYQFISEQRGPRRSRILSLTDLGNLLLSRIALPATP